jgi:hypothetical protein
MGTRYIALMLFSIAFGVEEAIIVVYLRQLPVLGGASTYALESWREFCTLLVIAGIAWLAGSSAAYRARSFCFAFGVWDVVYYIALWGLSGYPTLTQSDVLFLIPVPWIAPVWAPMAFAAILILIGVFGVARQRAMLLAGAFVLALLSFVYESAFGATAYPSWLFVVAFVLALAALQIDFGMLRPQRA